MVGASPNGSERVRFEVKQARKALRVLLADFLRVSATAADWVDDKPPGINELANLEEDLVHLRAATDLALERVGGLLDDAARAGEINAESRRDRFEWIAEKALAKARRLSSNGESVRAGVARPRDEWR